MTPAPLSSPYYSILHKMTFPAWHLPLCDPRGLPGLCQWRQGLHVWTPGTTAELERRTIFLMCKSDQSINFQDAKFQLGFLHLCRQSQSISDCSSGWSSPFPFWKWYQILVNLSWGWARDLCNNFWMEQTWLSRCKLYCTNLIDP